MANNNFVQNPRGNGPTPPRPRSFVEVPKEMSGQTPYDGQETDPKSVAAGGRTAAETAANTPKQDAGNPIGAGSLGNSQKPFTLKG